MRNMKMGFWFKMFPVFALLFLGAFSVEHSRTATGNPAGLLPDCPGSWKPATIKRKSLKKLAISVLGDGDLMNAKWTSYNYYHIGKLAKDPYIDFKNKKTFMFVPGYLDSTANPIGRGLGHIYKQLGYNVLILNTVHFTTDVLPIISRLMRPVGKHTAEMLANLTTHGLDPKDLEVVGLSLGGQIMSFIAKNYREITGKNISTLVALEPTGPCFRNLGPDQRIDKSDGDFVLSVATNIDGFGMAEPVGHVTFYVNGGEYQPGGVWWFPCGLMCSHARAYFIWISALLHNPGSFIGMQCDSVQQARDGGCYDRKPMITNTLDRFTDRSKPGIYYLATNNFYPYYLGKEGLKKSGAKIINFIQDLNKPDMIRV